MFNSLPSVLSCCWLGSVKSIRPVKLWSDEVLAWLSVWSEVQIWWLRMAQLMPLPLSPFASAKSRVVCPTQVVLEKKAVKWVLLLFFISYKCLIILHAVVFLSRIDVSSHCQMWSFIAGGNYKKFFGGDWRADIDDDYFHNIAAHT